MPWFDFLNPVFQPLLALGPFWAIFIISFVVAIISSLIYKYVTDQNMLKRVYEEKKEIQKRMKAETDLQKKMALQKELANKSMNKEVFKQQFKPTLFTIIPFLLIFYWMAAHLAYEPIYPGETYSLTAFFEKGLTGKAEFVPNTNTELLSSATQDINSEVSWKLKSRTEGYHILEIKYLEQPYTKKVLITKQLAYEEPITAFPHSDLKQIQINYQKLKPLGPDFQLFNWYPGWLAIYIVLSLVFSLGLRKALKIY